MTLHDLAYGRGDFEARLAPGDVKLYVKAMGSDGLSLAYYPVGVSSRRYLVNEWSSIMFQAIRNGVPRTIWKLELEPRRGPKPKGGTLRRILAMDGSQVKSRHLTKAQRAALDANVNFAGYCLMANSENLRCFFVRKDGGGPPVDEYDPSPKELKPPFFPITSEESRLLGFGAKRWFGTGKFKISHR